MRHLIKPPRKAKACAWCQHFAQNSTAYVYGGRGILGAIGEQPRGDCRAKPPRRDKKTGDALWPDVLGNDWCSAFARPETVKRGEAA
ncbi:hypothetical protein MKK63_11070 [Methylobacterium sp. J-088]|uniref:hypothetical protein n=1 Tax=Methylobacterium sp. J-088 TaxID=2836664 RepID=UPI001FB91AEB|nr:hypothetical protein [Methylobacterium sp. J-088]MCJ2063251.1 hypothetical protein [Methylobacterium sp. J-088]